MQKRIVFFFAEALEKVCLFQYSESDSLGKFLGEDRASEMDESFQNEQEVIKVLIS